MRQASLLCGHSLNQLTATQHQTSEFEQNILFNRCTMHIYCFFFFYSSQLNWFDFLLIDRLMMIMNRENGANAIFNFLLMRNNNQKIKHENYASGRNN